MPKHSEPKLTGVCTGDDESIQQANCLAESLEQYAGIAKDIYTTLFFDGSNFDAWSKSLIKTWTNYFPQAPVYFTQSDTDSFLKQNLIATTFIKNSVDKSLLESIKS
ncbi:hypothetical protein O181_094139 [Austropuccinia psidii MF-1]|uniref:Uncharacterized protein n=1 Tax=Austropuccinia psidii MF-1 TaxID=1389203 RepID=A0A9Q3J2U4_9BASI|nr:hypothetical protein [Austropuccinia psidii MF-1]